MFLCLSALFLSIISTAYAQYPNWTHYTVETTGMGNSVVNAITVDKNGNQWYGTNEGIAVFNGSDWYIYNMDNTPLPTNHITVLEADQYGNLWIGLTNKGLAKFDGTNWTLYSINNSNLPNDNVYDIKAQADTIWVATYKGLAKIMGDSISTITFYNKFHDITYTSVQKIAFDNAGRIWVGTNGDVFYKSGNTWIDLDQDGRCPLQSNVNILAMEFDDNNIMWISNGLLYAYNMNPNVTDAWSWVNLNTGNLDEKINGVEHLLFKNNTLWVGMVGYELAYGLAKYDETNWTFISVPNHIIRNVHSNFVMVGDSLYFGAELDNDYNNLPALVHYKNGSLTYQTNQMIGLASNSIRDLAIDNQQNIWLATSGTDKMRSFLQKFDGKNWAKFDTTKFEIKDDNGYRVVFDSNGNLWLGTLRAGLVKYDGNQFTIYDTTNSQIPSNFVRALAIDQNNNIWVGTEPDVLHNKTGGLAKFDGQSWTTFDKSNSPLTSLYITSLAVDQNNHIWVGAKDSKPGMYDFCLAEYDGNNWNLHIGPSENHALNIDQIYSLAVDHNNVIWIGSRNHYLFSYDGTQWNSMKIPLSLTTYPNNYENIVALMVDHNNTIWTCSYEMLAAYNGKSWYEYTPNNSPIPNNTYLYHGLVEDKDGYIWNSSSSGLFKVKNDPAIFTSIIKQESSSQLPYKIKLEQNYPNPFNPSTNISFNLPKSMNVHLVIYDAIGRKVADLSNTRMTAGKHNITWNATNNASGLYFIRLITPDGSATKKMILMK